MKWWPPVLWLAACNGPQKATVAETSASSRAPSSSAAVKTRDPIDALVRRLSARPLWQNGLSPQLELPASATPTQVVAAMFRHISFDRGPVKSHRIVETRRVRIGADAEPFTAVLLDTDQGGMVGLLRHESSRVGWWTRVYPASEPP